MFLDNEKTREYILRNLEEGRTSSFERRRALMIGHVWSSELAEILTTTYPKFFEQGYSLEDLSYLLQVGFDENSGD